MSDDFFDKIFEFKMQAKAFTKEASKAENRQQQTITKIKKAMKQGNHDLAKSLAQEAVRHKNDAKKFKTMGMKISTVASKLQQAYKTQQLSESITGLMNKMGNIAEMNDLTKVVETMDNFEKMFDNLDVQSKMMDEVFDNVNAGTVNEEEVNNLMEALQQSDAMNLDIVSAGNQQVQMQQGVPGQKISDFP